MGSVARHIPIPAGTRFGNWTVVGAPVVRTAAGKPRAYFPCRCECGTEREVLSHSLRRGHSVGCGCTANLGRVGRRAPEIAPGTRFGRWIIAGPPDYEGRSAWYPCRCDCGTERRVVRSSLVGSLSVSCGCFSADAFAERSRTHGFTGEKLHKVWHAMKQRCVNPQHKDFKDYGGRGIAVCADWQDDYLVFRTWALSHGYEEGLEIDRRDNNGPYSPDNCRFVTHQQNCANRRSRWRNRTAK